MEVQVEYEYSAQEPDELNLKIGDIITDVMKVQEGWCEGVLNGVKGVFPDNFVKELKRDKQGDSLQKKNIGGLNEIKSRLATVIVSPPPISAQKKVKRARVIYGYVPQNEDELPLEIGQLVEIIKQDEPGWWEGNLNGRIGMFPSNFVELVDKDESSEASEIRGRKIIGVGFGPNIFDNGQIALRPINPVSPPREKQCVVPPMKVSPGIKSPLNVAQSHVRAKVIYEYKAENPDELNMNVGDIIVVLDQNLEDVGWWKGDLNGKIGVFPDNFVELLTLEEKPQKRPPPDPENKPKIRSVNVPLGKHKHEEVSAGEVTKGLARKLPNSSIILQKFPVPRKEDLPVKPQVKENKDLNNVPTGVSGRHGITPEMFGNLQREFDVLKDQLEKMKKDHEKILLQLMSDIDEEKKNRFNIQVEIDRIKKLIASSSPS